MNSYPPVETHVAILDGSPWDNQEGEFIWLRPTKRIPAVRLKDGKIYRLNDPSQISLTRSRSSLPGQQSLFTLSGLDPDGKWK